MRPKHLCLSAAMVRPLHSMSRCAAQRQNWVGVWHIQQMHSHFHKPRSTHHQPYTKPGCLWTYAQNGNVVGPHQHCSSGLLVLLYQIHGGPRDVCVERCRWDYKFIEIHGGRIPLRVHEICIFFVQLCHLHRLLAILAQLQQQTPANVVVRAPRWGWTPSNPLPHWFHSILWMQHPAVHSHLEEILWSPRSCHSIFTQQAFPFSNNMHVLQRIVHNDAILQGKKN